MRRMASFSALRRRARHWKVVGPLALTLMLGAMLGVASAAPADAPVTVARAVVAVNGNEIAFGELVEIRSEVDNVEYAQAGQTSPVFGRFIGKAKPPTVVLNRVQTSDATLSTWHVEAREGRVGAFRDATLSLYAPDGSRTAQYVLANAWPATVLVEGAPAKMGQIVLETVTFVSDELIRV